MNAIDTIKFTLAAWNTGRLYTDKGQRISAVKLPNEKCMFYDIDRDIYGVTRIAHQPNFHGMEQFVMDQYDNGFYDSVYSLNLRFEVLTDLLRVMKNRAETL